MIYSGDCFTIGGLRGPTNCSIEQTIRAQGSKIRSSGYGSYSPGSRGSPLDNTTYQGAIKPIQYPSGTYQDHQVLKDYR